MLVAPPLIPTEPAQADKTSPAIVATHDLRRVLSAQRRGPLDPTTQLGPAEFVHATVTPAGPATLRLDWSSGTVAAQAWGPGAAALRARIEQFCAEHDRPEPIVPVHPAVGRALVRHRVPRVGYSGDLWHVMSALVFEQRVTTGEARQSYRRFCHQFGEPAPGPFRLQLPPTPAVVARLPYWTLHRFGVDRKRADALIQLARHAHVLARFTSPDDRVEARRTIGLIPGIGEWTMGVSLGPALGDPDAIAIGDYWLKHMVVHALAGRPRGTDEEMVELLEPYAGQRGRVVSLLGADGWRVQRFGPGQRVLPIARW